MTRSKRPLFFFFCCFIIRDFQLPVVTLPVARRQFMFFIKGPITLLFFIKTSLHFAHRLSALRPTCCIPNVNFQLLPFLSYSPSNLMKKGDAFQISTKSLIIFFCLINIKHKKNWTYMQSFSLISALLSVLWRVEFLNGDFYVKFQNCVLRFLKKFPCVFFEILYVTCACYDLKLKGFWCWSCKGLGSCMGLEFEILFHTYFFYFFIGFSNCLMI